LEWRLLAPLKRADERQKCLLIGMDRKGLADGQSDANDPQRMPRRAFLEQEAPLDSRSCLFRLIHFIREALSYRTC